KSRICPMNRDSQESQSTQQLIEQLQEENKRLKNLLCLAEERLTAALDGSDMKIWELSVPQQKLKVFNAPWGSLLGYQPHEREASLDGWKKNLHPDDQEYVVGSLEEHLQGKSDAFQVVHRMTRKDGSISWIADRGKVIEFDAQGRPLRMMGAHTDITNEKLYEERLASLINTDPLTGLLNRAALSEKFSNIAKSQKLKASLFFLDLDGFKYVNDHYGHKFGDITLCYIADILKSLTPANSLICRFGGDEFVILHEQSDHHELSLLSDRLLEPFQTPLMFESQSIEIGLSIGICVFDVGDASFSQVWQTADRAMYEVKKNGKNNVSIWDLEGSS
ncbi:MAG: diguanylate cyclase (GGDEF)-like protein/PAS domain S-box-containing protein, partial [Oceanospirillaceae bacterium]